MEEVILYRGTTKQELADLLNNICADVSWWTTNINNLSHYYAGACIELILKADSEQEKDYIMDRTEITKEYTFGRADMTCPKDSIWYSISKGYMEVNKISVKEIFPEFSDDEE